MLSMWVFVVFLNTVTDGKLDGKASLDRTKEVCEYKRDAALAKASDFNAKNAIKIALITPCFEIKVKK